MHRPPLGARCRWRSRGSRPTSGPPHARGALISPNLPNDHTAYSHHIESRAKAIAKHTTGHPFHIAPLHVDDLINVMGERAGTADARSERAAQMLQHGRAIEWPPARNDRWWCGSGRKYKQCYGPVDAAPAASTTTYALDGSDTPTREADATQPSLYHLFHLL